MTNAELLTLLEGVHSLTAQGILALRERIGNEGKYTEAALADMSARLQAAVGAGQKMADLLPDYRAFAPAP